MAGGTYLADPNNGLWVVPSSSESPFLPRLSTWKDPSTRLASPETVDLA
jgi:hypothetical protein